MSNPLWLSISTDFEPLIENSDSASAEMTSIFELSSHLNTMPSGLAGRMHLADWHPVKIGCGVETIIIKLPFCWTTLITLTVLPSFIYLNKDVGEETLNWEQHAWQEFKKKKLKNTFTNNYTSYQHGYIEQRKTSGWIISMNYTAYMNNLKCVNYVVRIKENKKSRMKATYKEERLKWTYDDIT